MKQLTCEMCGSTELIKQDGLFVCQFCGCKYSVEEAKKMMIEGTVEVKGTVKIDNTESVEKYLINARRAMEREDWEETIKYYSLVEENDPSNIEAIFYGSYGKAKKSLIDSDLYKRQAVFNVLVKCISLIGDNYDANNNYEEQLKVFDKFSIDLLNLFGSQFVYNKKKDAHGVETWNDKKETLSLFSKACLAYCDVTSSIALKHQNDEKIIPYYKIAIIMGEYCRKHLIVRKGALRKVISSYHEKIREIDPTYTGKTKEEEALETFVKYTDAFIKNTNWYKVLNVSMIVLSIYPVLGSILSGIALGCSKKNKNINSKTALITLIINIVFTILFILLCSTITIE